MKPSTDAFVRLKIEQQRILDFAILTCHSIPNLSKTIKGIELKVKDYGLAKPTYFEKIEELERLKGLIEHSYHNLAKYVLFSSWSFFEFYFKDAMSELLTFYGGEEIFLSGIQLLHSQKIEQNKTFIKETMKLREQPKAGKRDKYKNEIAKLSNIPQYTFTSELFSLWGAKYFVDIIAPGKFVSAEIPGLLLNMFGMDMSDKINDYGELKKMDLFQTFESMRTYRNRIGHGEVVDVPFNKAMAYNKFLRNVSVKIDNFLLQNYFVLNIDFHGKLQGVYYE